MKLLNKLERKFGRHAIHNLMYYVLFLYLAGAVIGVINPYFYATYLSLDFGKVFQGQIWRLVTFIIPPFYYRSITDFLYLAITVYLYYMIGNSLENAWGSFRFNLYFLSGIIFNIVAALILYLAFRVPYFSGLDYINQSMFFAFATLYPNVQFLLFFIIPIKVKYLGYLYGVIVGYEVITSFASGNFAGGIALLVSLANFLIFFLASRNMKKVSPRAIKRKAQYRSEVRNASMQSKHKCAICGRTEEDDENLEFRFCSRCDGNYEYCMEHLFTHEHVKKH